MNRRKLLGAAAIYPCLAACAGIEKRALDWDSTDIGMVVEYGLALNATDKHGVNCVSDKGRRLFGPAVLSARNSGTLQLGGASIPRWVRVTWRKDVENGRYWTTGTIEGDYTVPVLERIPAAAFDLARARTKQPLVLRFRIRDDGVDFGWMVRLQDGVPFRVLMRGGDF